jgi:ligand-binding sensor domain-containing protein
MCSQIRCGGAALAVLASVAIAMSAPLAFADPWQATDGPYGGGVVGLAVDGGGSVYAARNDDIFRSDDGGTSWVNVTQGSVGSTFFSIYCLYVTPGGDLYVGTASRGVYWSFDGGVTWNNDQITHDPHGGLGATIIAIGVNGNDVIFAGSFRSIDNGATWLDMPFYGNAFAFDSVDDVYAGSSVGVQFSDDEGTTWTLLDTGMEGERVEALAIDPDDNLLAGTRDSGVFLSTDAGATWSPVSTGLPTLRVEALAFDSAGRAYLALTNGGLYRSTDLGSNWTDAGSGLADETFLSLLATDGQAYAGNRYYGVLRSDDHGGSWTSAANAVMALPGPSDVAVSPVTGAIFLAAQGGGVYRSTNGVDWELRSDGLASTVAHSVEFDSSGRLYAGTDDGVYASDDEGVNWSASNAGHEGTAAIGILVDSDDGVYAVLADNPLQFVFSLQRSTDDGATWTEVLSDTSGTLPTTAESWAIDSQDRVFFGGMSVATESIIFISEDDGDTWDEVALYGQGTTSLAVDSSDRVYATMASNDLRVSDDSGVTWPIIPNGGWPTGTIGLLNVAAVDDDDAVMVSSRGSGIWRSDDGGTTWSDYSDGLPMIVFPTVRFIETAGGRLLAGTGTQGLFWRESGTGVEEPVIDAMPILHGITPNPFARETRISYELRNDSPVTVAVYDVAGRLVRVLESKSHRGRGAHEVAWDGRDGAGRGVAPGVYFVSVRAGGRASTGKVVVVR